MYNNFQNPMQNPYGYGYGAAMPKARNTQPLTNEQIAILRNDGDSFSMKVDEKDLWRAACTHKTKEGQSTLVANNDGTYTCTICHETFHLRDLKENEVEELVNQILDAFQTLKTVYVDAPDELITQYFQQICLLKKLPQLWKRGMNNFSMYENQLNPLSPINNPGTYGFAAMNSLLSNPFGGFQQPMYQAPVQQYPNQQPYGYYQQPVAAAPVMDPNANPVAYGVPAAPVPGMIPGQPMAAPVQAPGQQQAAPNGTEVQQQQIFNV